MFCQSVFVCLFINNEQQCKLLCCTDWTVYSIHDFGREREEKTIARSERMQHTESRLIGT